MIKTIIRVRVSMKPKDRRNNILSLLRVLHKEWPVKDLANELNVSELTIRRDLTELVKDGSIIRTHGGCVASKNGSFSTVFYKQVERNIELKMAIGREVAKLIKPGHTLLLGDGSTTFQFASHLENSGPITIYTNNIAAIQELRKNRNIRLYILGGEYDYEYNMLFLKGSLSDRILETLRFNLVIIGTDAVSSDGHCLSNNEEVARTNQIILRQGEQKILLADHMKVGAFGNVIYGKLSDFDLWITSKGLSEAKMNTFKEQTKIVEV